MACALRVFPDYESLSKACADFVARAIRRHPHLVIGLPTGDTPLGIYRELVSAYRRNDVDFSGLTTFNLDEYLGLPPGHRASFATYMAQHLWQHVNLKPKNTHIPSSLPDTSPSQECAAYEAAIRKAGGLDLTLLGIGVNGHIGFNEPGTPWNLATHVAELSHSTRSRQSGFETGDADVPDRAITMGIRTILSTQVAVLIASGSGKAAALERALAGPRSTDCPASSLQTHPSLVVLCDESASRGLGEQLKTRSSQHVQHIGLSDLGELVNVARL